MNDWDEDSFASDDQILPETLEEWERENLLQSGTPIPDEFFMQDDVAEQIDQIIQEVRGGIAFDKEGSLRAREHYEHETYQHAKDLPRKLRFERLEDRQGGDPWNQGEGGE